MASRILTRAHNWARSFRGLLPVASIMSSPPTPTTPNVTSSTITAATGGACSHPWTSPVFSYGIETMVDNGAGLGVINSITDVGPVAQTASLNRVRFMTDAPAFELVTGYSDRGHLALMVDNELAFDRQPIVLPVSSASYYTKYSFGSDVVEYELLQATAVAGGSGYAGGNELTLVGGTSSQVAKAMVAQVSGSAILGDLYPSQRGRYSVVPSSPASVTGGGGSGATLSMVWGKAPSTRKMRRIEFNYRRDIRLKGINVDAQSVVLPWPVSVDLPRLVIVGDSQQDGTFLNHGADHPGVRIAERLGLRETLAINARGGTGWNVGTGAALKWSDSNRIADIVALAPDIVVYVGSQNDTQNAALQTAITTALNTLLAALPNVLVVGIGPVVGSSGSFTAAGFAGASDQSRVRYINNVTEAWSSGSGKPTAETGSGNQDFYVASDGTLHLSNLGRQYWSDLAAARIADAVVQMTKSG